MYGVYRNVILIKKDVNTQVKTPIIQKVFI